MEPELKSLRSEYGEVSEEALALAGALSDRQFRWRPAPDRWSVGACLEHLARTAEAYFPGLESAVAKGRAKSLLGEGPFRYGAISGWLVRMMEPPPGRRLPTIRRFEPAPSPPKEPTLNAYRAAHERYRSFLEQADGLDLRRIKVRSPVTPLLRLPLGRAFAFLLAHERRHLWQARQVRNDPEFPEE